MKDKNCNLCRSTLSILKKETLEILKEAQTNPKILVKWLYENQGEMRFGSENRIFLVLVDTNDFNNSWKLKRNIDLLRPAIVSYLNSFKKKDLKSLQVSFEYKGKSHSFVALSEYYFCRKIMNNLLIQADKFEALQWLITEKNLKGKIDLVKHRNCLNVQ